MIRLRVASSVCEKRVGTASVVRAVTVRLSARLDKYSSSSGIDGLKETRLADVAIGARATRAPM
jgi:hypothetical protein